MDIITKYDENKLKIEKEAVIVIDTISLEAINNQLQSFLSSRDYVESQITYYQSLLSKAEEFNLKTKEEIEVEEIIFEEKL